MWSQCRGGLILGVQISLGCSPKTEHHLTPNTPEHGFSLIHNLASPDTLMETIGQQAKVRSNMHFISNKLKFGEDGVVSDIPNPIITSYTKADPKAFSQVAGAIKVWRNLVRQSG